MFIFFIEVIEVNVSLKFIIYDSSFWKVVFLIIIYISYYELFSIFFVFFIIFEDRKCFFIIYIYIENVCFFSFQVSLGNISNLIFRKLVFVIGIIGVKYYG